MRKLLNSQHPAEEKQTQNPNHISLAQPRPLRDLIYIPTLRCNCNCDMCYQLSLNRRASDEISPLKMISIIKESIVLNHLSVISLTGGEIFLLDDIIEFIQTMEEIGIICTITSNGFYVEKIGELLHKLNNKTSVVFHISIDGPEEIHDEIRRCNGIYQKAMESAMLIRDSGFSVSINTVMQNKNYDALESLKETIAEMQIPHNFIPLASSLEIHVNFSDEEVNKMLPFINTDFNKKYILSKGKFNIVNCHAGIQSCTIDPFGNVSACVSGLYKVDKNNEFFIGSLKEQTFDEIWYSDLAKKVINETVSNCTGCFLGCEVPREIYDYKLSTSLNKTDAQSLKHALSSTSKLDSYSINTVGWHSLESLSDETTFRWMSEYNSTLFLTNDNTNPNKKLEILYMNSLPSGEIKLSVELNNKLTGEIYCNQGLHTIIFPVTSIFPESDNVVEVKFSVDKLWSPNQIMGTADYRMLGIAICCVKLI